MRSIGRRQKYFSEAFTTYIWQEGIRREFTCRHTRQLNGVVEWKNRHILKIAREMMNKKHPPKSYWAEAANKAIYLMNHCTTSRVHDITPHEKFYGKKPDLSHVKIFDWIAFVHIPDEKQQKLYPKSENCILIGYSLEHMKGYKCFDPSTRKVWVSRDVIFDASTQLNPTQSKPILT